MSEGETANGGKIDTSTAAAARPLHPVDVVANEGGINLGHEAVAFVAPSSYLRPRGHSRPSTPAVHKPMMTALDREQLEGIVSAPLWDSKTSTFAGLLTTSDYMNVIQYYWQNPDALAAVDQFRLSSLREIERAIGVQPLETVSIHPLRPLYEACRKMLESRARRIPLLDEDDETNRSMVVSVVTQYRILKFIAVNVKETEMLRKSLRDLDLGTYTNLQTAKMESPVIDVIHMLVKYSISSIPILDSDGVVINVFEAVDVITLIKGGVYDDLNLNVGEALLKRSDDFPGIYTCTVNDRLDTIFDTIRKSRVHRLVVIDEYSRLKGLLTLSDILEYILLEGEDSEQPAD
ncbi:MAG: hypothetical protein Q9157_005315 [Trypethelium eluteriae]